MNIKNYFYYSNPHPKKLIVGDCVKRAIVHATGKPYQEVSLELNRLKKITGADSFNSKDNSKYYIEKVLKAEKISFKVIKGQPRMNGRRFAEAYPKGIYILKMAKHLTTCIDGHILDTWDCTDKCVYNAWKVG